VNLRIVFYPEYAQSPRIMEKIENNIDDYNCLEQVKVFLAYKIFYRDLNLPSKYFSQAMMRYHYSLRKNEPQPPSSSRKELKDAIAIVGMSLRLPGANTVEEFWSLLKSGNEGIIRVPDGRWNESQCFTIMDNSRETEAGFLNVPVDEIDAKFFGLSPKEVELMDPQQRLVLCVMHESLEHACINPTTLKGTQTGIFGGWWRNDFKEILQETGGLQGKDFFRSYLGNTLGTLTSRISHVLETTGPSISTESGCSTSIVAVDMACKSLLLEECNLGLAFGVNLFLHPFNINSINSVIAPDGRCKTFDENADGFGRAEGCTFIVLKRYPDALRDGDRIWAIIRGTAVVQDGMSSSMGTPTASSEALAMKLALERAGVQPQEVSFVEVHGTGTIVGDPLEVEAIREAYASTERKDKLIIGSVKTNIGHTESCSGIAGIIKTVLCMQNEEIPMHLNFKKINPDVHLDSIPAEIPLTSLDWKRCELIPRFAGVSSFGITGTNGHAIIQEPYQDEDSVSNFDLNSSYPKYFLKISAKCPSALDVLKLEMRSVLESEKESLIDVAFTANTGRGDYLYRTFAVGGDRNELIECISKSTKLNSTHALPKVCFLFTGQGSQYPGMARGIYEGSLLFRLIFDRCESIIQKKCSFSMKEHLWGGSSHLLKRSLYSQTCLFCVEYSLTELWKSWGVTPHCVLGHSLGEFAAACSAGILTFEDALTLVATRSQLIDALPCGKMIVVWEGQKTVIELLNLLESKTEGVWLDMAAINAPDQTVLAGNDENIIRFEEICRNNGISTHILDASHAFHSRLMETMLDAYRDVAETLRYSDSMCTFISGMQGRAICQEEVTAEYWVQHTRKSVQFLQASKTALLDSACDVFLEIGPHSVLSALLITNADAIRAPGTPSCIPSLRRKENDWTTILNSLGKMYTSGVEMKWEGFHQFSKGKKVTLPFYPFQKKKFELLFTNNRPRPFHPLVGSHMLSPSEARMFQSTLDLDSTPFLKDHVIGSACLFPGAGFLEMCLVAGHASHSCLEGSYQHPSNPIAILDFQIEAPMALQEDHGKHVQILISGEDGQQRISIHSRLDIEENTYKWIRQVSGTFSPYHHLSNKEEMCLKSIDLNSTIERCAFQMDIGDKTYASLAKHGYKFGPTFQTLRDGWSNETKTEVLCKGFTFCHSNSYVLHPVAIDALFQSILVSSASKHLSPGSEKDPDNSLYVPISIEKFIWFGHLRTEHFYIHCSVMEEQEQSLAILSDSD
jgi:acyl transferase domain-containing protein